MVIPSCRADALESKLGVDCYRVNLISPDGGIGRRASLRC